MPNAPRLIPIVEPDQAAGAVLVLHGGASRRGNPMVSPTQLSVLRMVPVARAVARAGRKRLAVYRVLNSTRGWDVSRTPVHDAHWAIDEVARRLDRDVPFGLVGHSLGGRAAIMAAARSEVRAVVALNPWVYPHDGALDLRGRSATVVHGDHDRIASASRSLQAARLMAETAEVEYVRVRNGKHAMLRRHRLFDRLAATSIASRLLASEPAEAGLSVRDV